MISLENELAKIKGIDRRFLSRLSRLKIITVKDLLWHFPSRYEDYSRLANIGDLEINQTATIQGYIKKVNLRRTWRRRLTIVEAIIADDTGAIKAIWFNQPYIAKSLISGRLVNFAGKVTASQDEIYFSNPAYEFVNSVSRPGHTAGLIAVYPETRGLTSRGLRYLIKIIIKNLKEINDFIPTEVLEENQLPELTTAIGQVHCPQSLDEASKSRRRFAFEDLFLLQISNLKTRSQLAKEKSASISFSENDLREIMKAIPFQLTDSQEQSLKEILESIKRSHPMNRLLQGDVGSGKTVVAAVAAILTAKNNFQAAFMAPTEVLARQHYKTLTGFFSPIIASFKLSLALLTGSEACCFWGENLESKIKKNELIGKIGNGEIKIIIGTHAIIQKNISFKNLALTIVDEQHRFGVRQRAHLSALNNQKLHPHFLSMSATPIPRTLSLTLFGDLDLSIISELPKGRRPIITKIVAPANRQKAYDFIRGQIRQGRQAFVICPRITASENSDDEPLNKQRLLWDNVKAVEEEYKKLCENIFPDLRVAMLHGRMKGKEKNGIMNDFYQNKINVLVSTSVVEIGVDIPNATIMMIEGADRFGLAQLYQFRGRVGRREHQSFCLLFTDSTSATSHQRLKHLIEAKNGFELAEKDLAMRGPGEFLGQSQTGLPDLAMSSLNNIELIKAARESAELILKRDLDLKSYPLLQGRLEKFRQQIHLE